MNDDRLDDYQQNSLYFYLTCWLLSPPFVICSKAVREIRIAPDKRFN
jgi:hypothetical protein